MRIAISALLFTLVLAAQNPLARPDPFVGIFQGDNVTLELKGSAGQYTGTLTVQGNQLPTSARAAGSNAAGTFVAGGQTYSYTLVAAGNGFVLTSEGAEYRLLRKTEPTTEAAATPAAAPAASNTSIVGYWRNADGYAKFNADGTGVIDGNNGRYEIRGNQLVLIGAQGQLALPFAIRGDVLTLTVNAQPVILNRVKEEAGGGGIRPELVGKWCWITQTYALQGARQSSRCVTLNSNGSYVYAGLTDSYNPNGGATGERNDSGTWTATDTTLTARSVTGKTVVYTLEKRNHPKNRNDPMIVLDGEPFVTQYNKPPW